MASLIRAAKAGKLAAVRASLASGVDVNTPSDSGTALFHAADGGYFYIVKALLAAGANTEATNKVGATPLTIAAEMGHLDIVKALLAAGANKDAKTRDYGVSSLFMAAQNGHLDIVNALLAAGANKEAKTKDGKTPLYIAAVAGNEAVVLALLQAGADVNAPSFEGISVLEYAKRTPVSAAGATGGGSAAAGANTVKKGQFRESIRKLILEADEYAVNEPLDPEAAAARNAAREAGISLKKTRKMRRRQRQPSRKQK